MTETLTKWQQAAQDFLTLPSRLQCYVAEALGVLKEGEASLPDDERQRRTLARVHSEGLFDQFAVEVEAAVRSAAAQPTDPSAGSPGAKTLDDVHRQLERLIGLQEQTLAVLSALAAGNRDAAMVLARLDQ